MSSVKQVDILLPKCADYEKWAVVACDQFTSQPDYWKTLDSFVGDSPSTLRLVYPEVYLDGDDDEKRIADIHAAMKRYLDGGVFEVYKNTFVLVERQTPFGNVRRGLVAAIDLEDYCFTHPSDANIRSTEGVVPSRIPPRLKIRDGAPLELPHVILLIDDEKKSIIEKLCEGKHDLLYDFDLNMGGGHLRGYRIDASEALPLFEAYETRKHAEGNFPYAVGDGNHSLASAQAYWQKIKAGLTAEECENHPARFALCEIENLYDDGIVFEPIHRFVFGATCELIDKLEAGLDGDETLTAYCGSVRKDIKIPCVSAEAIGAVQAIVEEYLKARPDCKADYIHGEENLKAVAASNNGVAIVMPKIKKQDLFMYVSKKGALCKKAFSMGEAQEKRYYVEAKRI